jgi:PAS domain S-box-containing protein
VQLSSDLESFFEVSSDLCCVLGWNGTIQAANPAWLNVLGYTRTEIQGVAFGELLHADDRKQVDAELARRTRSTFVTRCLCKDGTFRVLRWQTIASSEHRKVYAIGRPTSLTASRSEKLLALGQMALGVVHDLKNVIMHPLGLQLQRVERAVEQESKDRARTAIAGMRDVLRDGLEAIDRLMNRERAALVRVDLDPIAWRAIEIGRTYARQRDIDFDWQPGGPRHIDGDSFDLLAALVNLVFNAVDAIAERGTVTVKTGDGSQMIWLSISDNGPGMTNDVRDRIFEPFFTTKTDGIGIGLAIVQSCIERHNGSIRVITAPNAGTTMRIELPVK